MGSGGGGIINSTSAHKEISKVKFVYSGMLKVAGAVRELNNPISAIQVMRGLGGNPHRFRIMACYLHHRRVARFLLFVTDTK
jgi:hypothetical protein